MDLNYHYFTVKAVASTAGFPEDEAQRIAFYSQYIDDFDTWGYMFFSDVPDYARYLTLGPKIGCYVFNPVTTGFNSWYDIPFLMLPRRQKWIVTPYHFIPETPLSPSQKTHDWRVVPARLNIPSLISGMLKDARASFINEGGANRQVNLMRLGMLLHTFADTYAHQRFNGCRDWANNSRLEKVIDNIDDKDITGKYSPDIYYELPSIGHTNVYHAPDDSNVQFVMKQKLNKDDGAYSFVYERSNTREYCVVSKEIADYLLSCLGKPPMGIEEWEPVRLKLARGFLTPYKDTDALASHWGGIFKDIAFHYRKDDGPLKKVIASNENVPARLLEVAEKYGVEKVIYKATDDDFFRFNVLADQTRVKVNSEPFADPQFMDFHAEASAIKS
jgi:hypothetical protein